MDINSSIRYFCSLIDEKGIIQFSKGLKKDYRFGYAIEDQARALILSLKIKDKKLISLFSIILISSFKDNNGVLLLTNSKLDHQKKFDHYREASAEVFWALSELQADSPKQEIKSILDRMIIDLIKTPFPRVLAYTILGLTKIKDVGNTTIFADRLIDLYKINTSNYWYWFEKKMTYANALMPWSLVSAYEITGKKIYLEIGLESLDFLIDSCQMDNIPIVIGNQGWWGKDRKKAIFGQQPIDIAYLCLACLEAYRITKNKLYLSHARYFISWFLGNNLLGLAMIRDDGGCFDGLDKKGLNLNAGAESIICIILAFLELDKYSRD